MAVGDFNSDILRSSVFGRELTKFFEENDYIIGARRYLPENSFTFHSDAHDSVSWLDHVICSAAMFTKISSIAVLYNFLTSDHFVLSIKLDNVYAKQLGNLCDDPIEGFNIACIKWDHMSHDTVSKYTARTDLLLNESHLSCDAVYCSGGENCNEQHRQDWFVFMKQSPEHWRLLMK